MSLPHFFLREQVLAFESAPVFALHLDADDTKHAKVLRLAVGEHIAVVDAVYLIILNARLFLSRVMSFLRIHCSEAFFVRAS